MSLGGLFGLKPPKVPKQDNGLLRYQRAEQRAEQRAAAVERQRQAALAAEQKQRDQEELRRRTGGLTGRRQLLGPGSYTRSLLGG